MRIVDVAFVPPLLLAWIAVTAEPALAAKCNASKLAATGKRTAAELGCYAKAVGKGKPVDGGCVAKAAAAFVATFAKAEAKGSCGTSGDAAAVGDAVATTVADVVAALGGPGPSACTKLKLLAAGKKSAGKHACYAKAAGKGTGYGPAPACLLKVEAKFARAFTKAEGKVDCVAPSGDAAAIELTIDRGLGASRTAFAPARSPCGDPITPTALHGDGFLPNGRLARIVDDKVSCLHAEDFTATKCRFSTAPGSESGPWLESPAGLFAKTGTGIGKNGEPNGPYVVAADLRRTPQPCLEPFGMDTLGTISSGYELPANCTREEPLASYNDRSTSYPFFGPLLNWTDKVVCSSDAVHPDAAEYVGHGGFGDDVYCYTGYGAALNDANGVERDRDLFYLSGTEYCHVINNGGFEVPAAKRPASRSFPVPSLRVDFPILWRPVLRGLDVANAATPVPTPLATGTSTAADDASPTATPTPSPTVTPEPDFVVDTTADDAGLSACDANTANDCSLRGALAKAAGTLTPIRIGVPAGTYQLTGGATCPHVTGQFGTHTLAGTSSLCLKGNVTLAGAGAADTIIDGKSSARVLLVGNAGPVRVEGVTLRAGLQDGSSLFGGGGAVNNGGDLTLADCVVRDSSSTATGGGIYSSGTLAIERCTITGNTARVGGGVYVDSAHVPVDATITASTISDNHAAIEHGGGLFAYSANGGGTTTIRNTTIAGNDAGTSGGGVAIDGLDGTLVVTNSTISGNRCYWYYGGGLVDLGRSTIQLRNVTVTGNRSEDAGGTNGAGGGISIDQTTTMTLANAIIAGNTAPAFAPDCYDGTTIIGSDGYNLVGDRGGPDADGTYCDLDDANGDRDGLDPLLGPLADNGGPTATHLPAAGSPAIDDGNPAGCTDESGAPLTTDQRGAPRPVDGDGDDDVRCDRGAVEVP